MGNGTALKFNGTNAYLQIPISEEISNNEDFTLSMWIKDEEFYSPSHCHRLFETPPLAPGSSNVNWTIIAQFMWGRTYCSLDFKNDSIATGEQVCETTFPNKYHFVVTRTNDIVRVGFNGTFLKSFEYSGVFCNKNDTIQIGYSAFTSATYKYAKLILDDYCLIKGKALWTSNFTPPATYLPDKI